MCSTLIAWIRISVVLIPGLLSFQLTAQVVQKERFEVSLGSLDPTFEVIPADTSGLFVFRRLYAPKTDQLEIYKLDTALNINWHGYLPINRSYEVVGRKKNKYQLFLLLQHREQLKKDFQLITINPRNGEYVIYSIRNYIPFIPTEFRTTTKAAIIGGYFNNVPVVLYYSFITQSSKVIPGLLNEAGELTQVQVNRDDSFDVMIRARNQMKQQSIFIKNYDADGNLRKLVPVSPDDTNHLLFARSYKESEHSQVVAGTYGGRNSEYSRGVFLGRVDEDGKQELTFYNYGDLENFFKYMRSKQENRVRRRIEKREAKGKKMKFNYRLFVHQVLPYKDHYVMIAEAYYPRYLSTDRTFGAPALQSSLFYYRSGRIFDGYRYTHAVIIGFDKTGRRLWDNTFEINDVKRFTLDQFVKVDVDRDRMAMLYLYEDALRSKVIDRNEVLEPKKLEPIRTRSSADVSKPRRTSSTNLDYWYSDYLTASGVQEIVNWQYGERRVFFINKVTFQGQASN